MPPATSAAAEARGERLGGRVSRTLRRGATCEACASMGGAPPAMSSPAIAGSWRPALKRGLHGGSPGRFRNWGQSSASGGAWLERLTVVKMDTLAPHAELEHPTANGAWPSRRPPSARTPRGTYSGGRSAASTPWLDGPVARGRHPRRRPRRAPRPGPGAGERHRDRSGEAEEVARDRGRRDAVIPLAALEVGAKSDTDAGRGRRPRSRSTDRGSGEPPAPPLGA